LGIAVPGNILQNLQNIIYEIYLICELLLQVPTLIVYGENDSTPMAKQAPNNLRIMPNSQEVCLKNARHAAYLDQPDMFHKLLYNFMELLHHW
jgi:pimeloyl-ACP methyl ester carboxylesterase